MWFLHGAAGLKPEREGEELRHAEAARSRAAAHWRQKEPAVVVQASDQDAAGTPPLRGVSGTSIRVKTPG